MGNEVYFFGMVFPHAGDLDKYFLTLKDASYYRSTYNRPLSMCNQSLFFLSIN